MMSLIINEKKPTVAAQALRAFLLRLPEAVSDEVAKQERRLQQKRVSAHKRRYDAERKKLEVAVEKEIIAARNEGLSWTNYRPFLYGCERPGGALCGAVPGRHTTGRRSVVVSYHVGGKARTVLCEAHHKREIKESR